MHEWLQTQYFVRNQVEERWSTLTPLSRLSKKQGNTTYFSENYRMFSSALKYNLFHSWLHCYIELGTTMTKNAILVSTMMKNAIFIS